MNLQCWVENSRSVTQRGEKFFEIICRDTIRGSICVVNQHMLQVSSEYGIQAESYKSAHVTEGSGV